MVHNLPENFNISDFDVFHSALAYKSSKLFEFIAIDAFPQEGHLKCGISLAPVTDWRLYDRTYSERFMGL